MAIDMYSRRAMARALKQMTPARTFIRDMFFKARETSDKDYVDVDIQTQPRRMASFVSPRSEAKVTDKAGFITNSYKPPLVSNKSSVTGDDLVNRVPGEDIYEEGLSPEEREAQHVGMILADLDNMVTRREEWMCIRALFAGQVEVVGDGVSDTIPFGRLAENVIALPAAARRWDAATAKIIEDLSDWRRICVKNSGLTPDVAVLGTKAANALKENSALMTALDNYRMEFGQIRPDAPDMQGVSFIGTIEGLRLFAYDEWYVDPADGLAKAMVPEKQVMLCSTMADMRIRYAAVPLATGTDAGSSITLVRGARVPDSWVEKDPATRWVKVASRPLPVPVQINASLVATVVA